MTATDAALQVRDMRTWFAGSTGPVKAVDGVDLEVLRGQALGIVGESGCGKSSLVRSILGIWPDPPLRYEGQVVVDGVDLMQLPPRERRQHLGTGVAVVLQDPMRALNPVRRIDHQITEMLTRRKGMQKRAARARAGALLQEVGIDDAELRLGQYPGQLSGGLRQRVAIAIALSGDPSVLLADEPTTALDVTVQAQILALFDELRARRGLAVVLISHDLEMVASFVDRVAVMYAGRIVEAASPSELLRAPRMPYTRALLAARPHLRAPGERLASIDGRPPNLGDLPVGCAFAPRCSTSSPMCRAGSPTLTVISPEHDVACFHPAEVS
ncbi:MAG TPA: ABC transporter ATP-binding protein [Ilumatobacteraceae bacterium]|nr:ABC transporter ATP-binding protein [Ilumatobacteraceae bacterium]HRB03055.1 ABC transporter ATP-binding protein [Ilumatobacteraceae bacterium]